MRIPRPPILDRIPIGRHAVVEASAGTGKTYTLEHLVVEHLIRGASLDEILVVTFTEKATREMRARVRTTLGRIVNPTAAPVSQAPEGDGQAGAGASAQPRAQRDADGVGAPMDSLHWGRGVHQLPSETYWSIDGATRARLEAAYLGFERAPISTIHGFCQRVLADHAFRSHRPFTHELVEPRRAFGRAFRDELRVLLSSDSTDRAMLLRMLDELPADALEAALYPWFVERGEVRPSWDEERFSIALEGLVGIESKEADVMRAVPRADVATRLVGQLAALGRLAKRHAGHAVLPALLAVDAWSNAEVVQGRRARTWVPERLAVLPALHEQLQGLLDVAPPLFGVLAHRLLPRVRVRLDAQKAERGQVDFDDMLSLVAKALEAPEGAPLVDALRRQYRHALVDEFQDTDEVQWSIFRQLFVAPGATGTLTVIGDPKQAIYGFRNADVHTYNAVKDLLAPEGAVPLVDCYRATDRLITAYNRIFAEDFFEGDVAYDQPVRCGDPTKRLTGREGNDAAAIHLWQVLDQRKPTVRQVRAAIGARIAVEARALVEDQKVLWHAEGQARPLRYRDLHVLVRNAHEADSIAEVLRVAGIPHAFFKQEGLFQTSEAHDLLAMLRALADPLDRAARSRAWLTAFFEVPLEDLHACRSIDALHPLALTLQRWQRRAERHDPSLLRSLLDESGLVRRLLHRPGGARALTNYEHLVEILLEESGGHRGVRDLVALLEAFIDGRAEPVRGGSVQRVESDRDAVQLLTMHKAKGLEAAVVFLAGGFTRGGNTDPRHPQVAYREEDGERVREAWLPPLPAEVEARVLREAREEDERLLYVALTRAKGRLYLPYFGAPPAHHAGVLGAVGRQRYGPLTGPYRWLDQRLETLVTAGFVDDDVVVFEAVAAELVPERPLPSAPATPLPAARPTVDFERVREAHRGFQLTSYSRMKAGRALPTELADVRPEEFEIDLEGLEEEVDAARALPGGASMGIFLHEVLEHLDRGVLRSATRFEAWEASVARRASQSARRHGVDESHLPDALRLIYDALRAPQEVGSLSLPEGLCAIDTAIAELELLYPIPEPEHPPLGTRGTHRIGRGLIRGILDLVFERDGLTYFLDWKSDRVVDDPSALQEYVRASYGLQAKLYTLGVVRMLGVGDEAAYEAQFGGLLYCFLRVMTPHRGMIFERPTWDEVLAWDAELRASDTPFGYPLR